MNDRIHILCYGNPLHGDDGFGSAVFQKLQGKDLGDKVNCFDAGIAGLNSLSLYENCERVLIVDACSGVGDIGALQHFSLEQYLTLFCEHIPVHDFDLNYLLQALPSVLNESIPVINLLCVEIDRAQAFHPTLSTEIQAAVDEAVNWISEKFNNELMDLNFSTKASASCL